MIASCGGLTQVGMGPHGSSSGRIGYWLPDHFLIFFFLIFGVHGYKMMKQIKFLLREQVVLEVKGNTVTDYWVNWSVHFK